VIFSVEAWAPEYGSPTDDDPFELDDRSDLGVEVPPDRWAPVPAPDPPVTGKAVVFVDGVMRADARVWVRDEAGGEHPGLCCSYAAGAIRCDGRAEITRVQVERGLFTAAPDAEPIATRLAGTFEVRASAALALDSNRVVIPHMRARERDLAHELGGDADLVVADGPLHDLAAGPHVVGYVKTHHATYLPDPVSGVVDRLEPGERTPLFLATTRWSRYSWYLRLPGPRAHSWSGVVRCEASAELEPAQAVVLANAVCGTLPRFASTPHKDPRAPQNLFPIAGLERELHRRLGDPQVVWRDLRRVAAGAGPGSG
jgi:hypothetical protein